MDLFTDQNDVLWEDWLLNFELAAAWNNWTEEEKLWQLAGHLRGKVSQEWTLLSDTDKLAFASDTDKLAFASDTDKLAFASAIRALSKTIMRNSAANDRFKGGKCWKAGHIAADCRGSRHNSSG